MSGFMSIFNGFRNASTTLAPQPPGSAPGQPPNPVPTQDNSQTTNPTVPSSATPKSDGSVAAIPAAESGNKSPLDSYSDLWKPEVPGPAGTRPNSPPTLVPNLNVDPVKIMEAAKGMDFTRGINPEVLQKAARGNDPEALASLISSVAQNAYAQSAMATTRIVQSAMEAQNNNFNQQVMPAVLRKFAVSQAVSENPMTSNPAAAPLLQALETQLSQKFPTASPQEIKNHAATYLDGFAQEIVRSNGGTIIPKDNPQNGNPFGNRGGEEDWEKYFGVASPS